MTESAPLSVSTRYFDALVAGDIPTVVGLFSDEVVWHQPGANRFSGVHVGPAAVGALTGGMMERSGGTFRLSVVGDPMVNGACVAVPVRFQGERDGLVMDITGIDLLEVEDGRIVRVDLFGADQDAEDEFWGAA